MCLYVQENVQINQILVTRGADRQRNIDLVDHHSPGKSQMPKKMPHGFSFQCLHHLHYAVLLVEDIANLIQPILKAHCSNIVFVR